MSTVFAREYEFAPPQNQLLTCDDLAGPVGRGLVRSHDLHVVHALEDSWITHRTSAQLALNLVCRLPSVVP
jgi:hypothetical protein